MNVLLLMVDELSWWALGHTGGIAKTPNIDALAQRSLRFTQAYTPSPICVPTRAAIATGRDVHDVGCWSSAEPYDGQIPSWGHAVQSVGVPCVSIGKLHYRSAEDDTGFDAQLEPIHVVDGVGWVQALLRRPVAPMATPESLAQDIGAGKTDYHDFDLRVTERACAWLAAPERQVAPWCGFVSWLAPHFPLIAPAEYMKHYDPKAFETPAQPVPDHPVLRDLEDYFSHDRFFSDAARGVARAAYYGLCSFVDAQVGRVLSALDQAGLSDDTLVLFTSDHGEMLGEKGFWTKSTMYDSAAKVPLLMSGPGITPGRWDAPVSLIDLAPTICTALGAPCDGFSGQDLGAPDPERTVLSQYHDGGAPVGLTMLRWDHWKLVHYAEGHPAQLFDLTSDPEELTDLALTHPLILAEGAKRLSTLIDPEVANEQAHADQAARVDALGGPQAVLDRGQFDYTPAG